MALPNQIGAYEDCLELYEKAAANPKGARRYIGPSNIAKQYQLRMHQARSLLRKEAKRMYPKDDTRYDKSEYDHLKVTIREDTEGDWWAYVEPHGLVVGEIEEIE